MSTSSSSLPTTTASPGCPVFLPLILLSRSGFTGQRMKPLSVLPTSLLTGFEEALLVKVPDRSYLLLPTWQQRVKMVNHFQSFPNSCIYFVPMSYPTLLSRLSWASYHLCGLKGCWPEGGPAG